MTQAVAADFNLVTRAGPPRRVLFLGWILAAAGTVYALDYESRVQFGQGTAVASLAKLDGVVQFRSSSLPVWAYARGSQLVYEDNILATGNRSSAVVEFNDGRTISIQPNSQIAISSKSEGPGGESAFVVSLLSGSVSVSKAPEAREVASARPQAAPVILKVRDQEIKISDPKTAIKATQSESSSPVIKVSGGAAELKSAGGSVAATPISISAGNSVTLPPPEVAAIASLTNQGSTPVKIEAEAPVSPAAAAPGTGANTTPGSTNAVAAAELQISLDGEDFEKPVVQAVAEEKPVAASIVDAKPVDLEPVVPAATDIPNVANVTTQPQVTPEIRKLARAEVVEPKEGTILWTIRGQSGATPFPDLRLAVRPKEGDGAGFSASELNVTPVGKTTPTVTATDGPDPGAFTVRIPGRELPLFALQSNRTGLPVGRVSLRLTAGDGAAGAATSHRFDIAALDAFQERMMQLDLGPAREGAPPAPENWFMEDNILRPAQVTLTLQAPGGVVASALAGLVKGNRSFKLRPAARPIMEGTFAVKDGRIVAAFSKNSENSTQVQDVARRMGADLLFSGPRSALLDPRMMTGNSLMQVGSQKIESIYAVMSGTVERVDTALLAESEEVAELVAGSSSVIFTRQVKLTMLDGE
jgi:hypothetical protein